MGISDCGGMSLRALLSSSKKRWSRRQHRDIHAILLYLEWKEGDKAHLWYYSFIRTLLMITEYLIKRNNEKLSNLC